MIDLEKTIDDLKLLNALCHGTVLDDAIALMNKQEIVRCKDCTKRYTRFCPDVDSPIRADDWFCADGHK